MFIKTIFTWDSNLKLTDLVLVVVALVNLWFVFLVYKFTRKDINPKLYVRPNQIDVGFLYSKTINKEILETNFNIEGFPMKSMETFKLWELSLANSSDLPATKIKLKYEVVIKRAKIEYGELDKIDVDSYEFVPFKRFERIYKLDYLAPHAEVEIPILYLTGDFSEAEVYVNLLESNERKFLKERIRVDTFKHPDWETIQDNDQLRQMLGVYYNN